MTQVKIIDRIQKLLALSVARGATEAEAESASALVQELLLKHNLSLASIEAATTDAPAQIKRVRHEFGQRARYKWQQELASAVASAFFCFYMLHKRRDVSSNRRRSVHIFVGREDNVATAQMMYTYLCETIERMVPASAGRLSRAAVSWRMGCADRLRGRLWARRRETIEAQDQATAQTTSGTAIVLAADFVRAETDANYEFAYGFKAGTVARWRAENAAARTAEVDRSKPEKKISDKERERQKRAEQRRYDRHERQQAREAAKIDWDAFRAGRRAAEDIGLDTQLRK